MKAALRRGASTLRRIFWTRRALVAVIVVVATVLALGAAIAVYAREVALDTTNFTDLSGELLENDEIRPVVASYLVTQLYARVDVAAALTDVLPDQFDQLGTTAAAALRQLTLRTANQLLADPAVQQLWRDANREAHEQFVAAVEGDSTFLTAEGDVVLVYGRSSPSSCSERDCRALRPRTCPRVQHRSSSSTNSSSTMSRR